MKSQWRSVAMLSFGLFPLAAIGCFPDYPAPKDVDGETIEDVAGDLDGALDGLADSVEDTREVTLGETASDVTDVVPDTALDTAETSSEIVDAVEPPPEVAVETEVSEVADSGDSAEPVDSSDTHDIAVDTAANDDTAVAETAADTELPSDMAEDIADTTDTAEVEVDPCPSGCTHLDEACKVGVCGEAGCEAIDADGDCDDDLACTTDDRCEAGVCVGDAVVCEPKDDCHIAGVCNPSNGLCSDPTKNNNTGCNDADQCTEGDACQAGICVGGGLPDDSGDWSIRAPASLGPTELVVDSAGALWWFVSLTATTTDFGTSAAGGNILITLPSPSTFGVGVVRMDAHGKPVSAMLLAHSSTPVELPPVPSVVARIITTPNNQSLPVVVMTGEGATHFPGAGGDTTLTPRAGARLTYFAAYYNADGTRQNVMQVESEAFAPIGDLKAVNYPGITIGANGQVALAIPLEADKTAEVTGKASIRASAEAVASTWYVKLGSGLLLWSRILEGTSPTLRFATSQVLSMDADGDVWTAGWYVGTAHWRRADEAVSLSEIPDVGQSYGMFVGHIDTSAALVLTSHFKGFGRPFRVRQAEDGTRTALVVVLSGVLSEVSQAGSTPITGSTGVGTVPLLEFDASSLTRTLTGTAAVSAVAYRGTELDVLLATTGEFGDGTKVVQVEAEDALVRVPTSDSEWSFPLAVPVDTANNPAFIVERLTTKGQGFVALGRAFRGGYRIQTSPSTTVIEGEVYLFQINSENGQVCEQR